MNLIRLTLIFSLLASAGCTQSSESFARRSRLWASWARNIHWIAAICLISTQHPLPDNATPAQIAKEWEDSRIDAQEMPAQAAALRKAFNNIGQPPDDLRDVYETMKTITEMNEQIIARLINRRGDTPSEVWASIEHLSHRSDQLMDVLKLRIPLAFQP